MLSTDTRQKGPRLWFIAFMLQMHVSLLMCKCHYLTVFCNDSFHIFLDHTECLIEGQVYKECKGCDGTCWNQNPICPAICVPGCSCVNSTYVVHKGKCIPKDDCPGKCCPDSVKRNKMAVHFNHVARICVQMYANFWQQLSIEIEHCTSHP